MADAPPAVEHHREKDPPDHSVAVATHGPSTKSLDDEPNFLDQPLALSRGYGGVANTQLEPWSPTFRELCAQFQRTPEIGPKDGDYWVRGPFRLGSPTRSDNNIEYARMLVLDGDGSIDRVTGEIIIGSPPPVDVHEILVDLDIPHILHPTYSNGQPGKGNRYHVLIPVIANNPQELRAGVAHVLDLIQAHDCNLVGAKENNTWSQAWYFPRLATDDADYFCYVHTAGKAINAALSLEWYGEDEDSVVPTNDDATETPDSGDQDSLFTLFRTQNDNPEWIRAKLESNDYKLDSTGRMNGEKSYRYLSPHSTSGRAGVNVFKDINGIWRVCSHHSAEDPLSDTDGSAVGHDAWDLYRILEYDDDQAAALSAWREERSTASSGQTSRQPSSDIPNIEDVQPLDPTSFPNLVPMGQNKGSPQETIKNYRHLFKGYGINAWYDVIGKRVIYSVPGMSGCPDNAANSALAHIISLAKLNGLPVGQIQSYIAAIADTNQLNPVTDYITSVPWDGQDRLEALYATLKTKDGYSIDLKKAIFMRWLISAVAAACNTAEFRSRGVFVLQGPQSIGKTSFFLALIDDLVLRARVIKIDHHLDASSKDSTLTAIRHWIVEIGELDYSFKKDVARLKGFITDTMDKIRQPYGKLDSEFPRRTVFCASVNSENFLVDDTGNTRWWTVPVIEIDYEHSINMQQLWAQVYTLYKAGEQWWLTREEEVLLEEYNRGHRAVNAVRDLVEAELDLTMPQEKWIAMTATEVLVSIGIKNPSNPQMRDCGTALREYLGDPTKSKGRTRWKVPFRNNQYGGPYG